MRAAACRTCGFPPERGRLLVSRRPAVGLLVGGHNIVEDAVAVADLVAMLPGPPADRQCLAAAVAAPPAGPGTVTYPPGSLQEGVRNSSGAVAFLERGERRPVLDPTAVTLNQRSQDRPDNAARVPRCDPRSYGTVWAKATHR